MIAPASRKDQPNHILAQTNKLIIMGNKNCPPETNALIRIFAVLGGAREGFHQTGIGTCI